MAEFDFVAIDVETANADVSSICQIGIAGFSGGHVVDQWSSLVDPEDEFDWMNISIHGINEEKVEGAPTFADVRPILSDWCDARIVVCHTPFDRTSVYRASGKYGLQPPECTWLDSARVVRRAWEQFAMKGYGLRNVCSSFGYEYRAHDALEDAKACGFVLCRAMTDSGLSLEDWLVRVKGPLVEGFGSAGLRSLKGDPSGPLFGESLVFTGALTMPRREAAATAAATGADVTSNVGKKTTILVVGDQDIRVLGGHEKSSKHRKAEGLIREGHEIRIIGESDFFELVRLTQS